jgi:hypothetical protein
MLSMRLTAVVLSTMMLSVSGCSTTPNFDSSFGYAVNAAKAQQTLNPDAALNRDPVTGIEGPAATKSTQEYYKSFEKPVETFPIFITGSGSEGR